jgi:hypothetical protein
MLVKRIDIWMKCIHLYASLSHEDKIQKYFFEKIVIHYACTYVQLSKHARTFYDSFVPVVSSSE